MTFRKRLNEAAARLEGGDVKVWFFAAGLFGTGTAHARCACKLCFKLPEKPMWLGGRHQKRLIERLP
jgi:hypothetical protein